MVREKRESPTQRLIRETVERTVRTPWWRAQMAEHKRREAERIAADPKLAERVAKAQRASEPILFELRGAGIRVERLQLLPALEADEYKLAEPILLKWLAEVANAPVAMMIASALRRKGASSAVAPVVLAQIERWRGSSDPQADLVMDWLAQVLERTSITKVAADVRQMALDPAYGDARIPLTEALGKTRDPESGEALLKLMDDPLIAPYAAKALGRRGDEAGRSKIEGLLSSPEPWVRKEAERALRKLDKKAARPGGPG